MKISMALLVGSLVLGIGGWMVTLKTWDEATTTVAIGGLLMVVGSVVCAWLGQSPLKAQNKP